MKYTKEQYIQAINAFNKKNLEEKLNTIKNSDILKISLDNGWSCVEIVDISKKVKEEIEEVTWFEWDTEFFTSSQGLFLLFNMSGLV